MVRALDQPAHRPDRFTTREHRLGQRTVVDAEMIPEQSLQHGAQRIFLLRSQKTVVTVLSGRYNDFSSSPPERLLVDYIMPALPPASGNR